MVMFLKWKIGRIKKHERNDMTHLTEPRCDMSAFTVAKAFLANEFKSVRTKLAKSSEPWNFKQEYFGHPCPLEFRLGFTMWLQRDSERHLLGMLYATPVAKKLAWIQNGFKTCPEMLSNIRSVALFVGIHAVLLHHGIDCTEPQMPRTWNAARSGFDLLAINATSPLIAWVLKLSG